MKKLFMTVISVFVFIFCSFHTSAFELEQIKPDDSFLNIPCRNVSDDIDYLRGIAQIFSDSYVVTEERQADVTEIDRFFTAMSTPLSLEELDAGQINLYLSGIGTKAYQQFLKEFKVIGGIAGYSAEFEPVAYYRIYRDIVLVGGYTVYTKTYENPDDAYWQYICDVEGLTKEIVPYEARIKLLERVKCLSEFMDSDTAFKVFLLKDGQIDSMYNREVG